MQVKEEQNELLRKGIGVEPRCIPKPYGERRLRDTRESWRSPSPGLAASCRMRSISFFSDIFFPHLRVIVHIFREQVDAFAGSHVDHFDAVLP
jgi:hypothetical protein